MLITTAALALLLAQTATSPPSARPGPSFETLSRQAETARNAGRLDEAVTAYQKALRLRPKWDEGWWNLGSIAYDRDRFADCASAFSRLNALKQDLSAGWIMSGLCQYSLRNFSAARASLLQAERLRFEGPPELSMAARLQLALVLTKTGTFEKAIILLTELTRMSRRTPEIAVAAGIAGLRKQWTPGEVPETDRDKVSRLGDAMASVMELDPKGATEKFDALLKDYPDEPDIHFRFGAFLMQQSPERGLAEIKTTLRLDPVHIPALVGLTMLYLKNGETQTALPYAKKAVEISPGDFATHIALGRTFLETNNVPGAVEQLELAAKLAPDSADAHFSLASAYQRADRKEEAQHEQEIFRRLRKQIDDAH